jgi:hypothetical protein
MLFQEWQREHASQGDPDPYLQSLINSALPLPLRCLATKVLRQSVIPFDDVEKVPPTLWTFIQWH